MPLILNETYHLHEVVYCLEGPLIVITRRIKTQHRALFVKCLNKNSPLLMCKMTTKLHPRMINSKIKKKKTAVVCPPRQAFNADIRENND